MDMGLQYLHGATSLVLLLATACVYVAAAVGTTTGVVELTSVLMSNMKSPLSKSEAITYAELYKHTGSVANLCQAGHFYCDAQAFEAYYEKVLQPQEFVKDEDIAVFFRESEIMVGHQMTIVDPRLQSTAIERNRQAIAAANKKEMVNTYYINVGKMPERAFLPAELAQMLPFSGDSAVKIFGLDESSTLAKESRKTVEVCSEAVHKDGTTALKGETAACATSLEELQSLLQSPVLLGSQGASKVEALTMDHMSLRKSVKAEVMEVKLKASVKSRHAVCHNLMYPSAVYFCHYLANTRVYAVSLQATEAGSAKVSQLMGVAICHLDTSGWNPGHLAFQNLGTLPGHSEACHWLLPGSVTFVPAA